jgi:hypothetical protein
MTTMTTSQSTRPEPSRSHSPATTQATRLPVLDLVGIAGLATVIAIHTSELSGKVEETAYLGFGYVLLIAASLVSIVMLTQRDVRGWYLGGLTSAATIIGFVLTRTTGLPNAKGDIGNWGETVAVWSLIAEGLVVLLTLFALGNRRKI